MTATAVLAAWCALSVPGALFVGAFIRAGQRPRDTRPSPHTNPWSHR